MFPVVPTYPMKPPTYVLVPVTTPVLEEPFTVIVLPPPTNPPICEVPTGVAAELQFSTVKFSYCPANPPIYDVPVIFPSTVQFDILPPYPYPTIPPARI